MSYKIFAKSIWITHKISKSSSCICSCLFFLILQKLNQNNNTRFQMFIKNIVMETSISYSKTCKLSSVPVYISTTFYSCCYQSEFQEFFVEKASVSAQITYKITNFRSYIRILMYDKRLQVVVNICIVNGLIKIFAYSRKLTDQWQTISYQVYITIFWQQLVFLDCSKSTSLHELLCEILWAFCCENKFWDQADSNRDIIIC